MQLELTGMWKPMAIVSIINQKGGVAKTTTSINVAASWASIGKRILLIDLDPQSSATKAIFGDREFDYTIYDVICNRKSADEVVIHSKSFGIDVIPAEILLSGVDIELAAQYGREQIIRKKLQTIKTKYDSIIFDCSPSLGLLTVNALMASDDIIIPICPEYFSMKGIELIIDTLKNLRTGLGHDVKIRGIVITRFKNRKIVNEVIEEVRKTYGVRVFSSYIPDNIAVEEAHHHHVPVNRYAPKSKASEAYMSLSREIWQ